VRNTLSFLRPAAPIVGRKSISAPSRATLVVTDELGTVEAGALEERAKTSGASLNDVAVAVLFGVIAGWNRDIGTAGSRQRLRILVPTDLRDLADRHLPAANRLGFWFPLRQARQCTDGPSLLAGVVNELTCVKRSRLGLDFVRGVEAIARVPGALPLLLRTRSCMASAVLTNLDDPGRRFRRRFPSHDGAPVIGNLILKRIYGAPPIRPGTRAGFGLARFGGQLTLTARCDPAAFDEAAARELLRRFADGLRDWTAGRPDGGAGAGDDI
jgi:hypothetical protein